MSKRGKQVFALIMALMMALMVIVPSLSLLVNAAETSDEEVASEAEEDFSDEKETITDLNSKYKDLQAQQNKINAQLGKAKSEKDKQLAIRAQIDGQIQTTIAQIDLLDARIALLSENIAEKEQEMHEKQGEIDKNFGLLQTRMRAMYMSGGTASTLGMVLGADSYSQFLMRAEMVSRVAQHDQDLIVKLSQEKKELEEIKTGIEDDKKDVLADKAEMDEKNTELGAQKAQAQDRIQTLADTEKAFMADKANLQKQMAQVQAEISKIYAAINRTSSKIPYIGGVMKWPSASLFQITSPFGMRFGGSNDHTGMDISGGGAYGSAVLAANTGTVAVANTAFTPGYGYGKYVIIDHGGGVQTLYGHCSAITVKVGQTVATGEKIGEVGSTGWSTGPHIHFEVRRNGKAENPAGWLQG